VGGCVIGLHGTMDSDSPITLPHPEAMIAAMRLARALWDVSLLDARNQACGMASSYAVVQHGTQAWWRLEHSDAAIGSKSGAQPALVGGQSRGRRRPGLAAPIDWVPIGNPHNAAATASNCLGSPADCGSVDHVMEWNESKSGSDRSFRAGSWVFRADWLAASDPESRSPDGEREYVGFRVASLVPEPEGRSLLAVTVLLGLTARRKRQIKHLPLVRQ